MKSGGEMDFVGRSARITSSRSTVWRRRASSAGRIRSGTKRPIAPGRQESRMRSGQRNSRHRTLRERSSRSGSCSDDAVFVETIPLTSTGKMDKKTVRARISMRAATTPSDLRGEGCHRTRALQSPARGGSNSRSYLTVAARPETPMRWTP